jgi:integrase/recombinase XerD
MTCPTCLTQRAHRNPGSTRVSRKKVQITYAMALRHAGIDLATIALWLGHSTTRSTDIYMHVDPAIKEQAPARTAPADAGKPGRYKPGDSLLAFLENL